MKNNGGHRLLITPTTEEYNLVHSFEAAELHATRNPSANEHQSNGQIFENVRSLLVAVWSLAKLITQSELTSIDSRANIWPRLPNSRQKKQGNTKQKNDFT